MTDLETDLIIAKAEIKQLKAENEILRQRLDNECDSCACEIANERDSLRNELCDALESYKSFADRIAKLPDCNDCASKRDCPYLPNWGTTTRINCPLHKPLPAAPEEGAEK